MPRLHAVSSVDRIKTLPLFVQYGSLQSVESWDAVVSGCSVPASVLCNTGTVCVPCEFKPSNDLS